MDERAQGLVLRIYPLTETSLIVHWLTNDFGRIATVAKGARRPKSPFRGKLDLFHLCDLLITRSRHSELHTLKEVSLIDAHATLRGDFDRLRKVVYASALVEQTTETDSPVPELFDLLISFIREIAAHATETLVLAFELKLLLLLGLTPNLDEQRLSPGGRKLIEFLTDAGWDKIPSLRMTVPQGGELRRFLEGFLIYHLGKVPRSRGRAFDTNAKSEPKKESGCNKPV